jgi:hypothetical protein
MEPELIVAVGEVGLSILDPTNLPRALSIDHPIFSNVATEKRFTGGRRDGAGDIVLTEYRLDDG